MNQYDDADAGGYSPPSTPIVQTRDVGEPLVVLGVSPYWLRTNDADEDCDLLDRRAVLVLPDGPDVLAPAPARDMPRERLVSRGSSALSDIELLVLVLGTGLPGHDVFDIARSLLARFGTLRAMLDAAHTDFEGVRGIGPARKAKLLAIMEMARRALVEKVRERPLIDSPQAVEDYLRLAIGLRPYEVFICLYLDAKHRLIRIEEAQRGSLTRMAVYPREIVRRALSLNAASLIVAHNHPSGAVEPSAADIKLTASLAGALALVDVTLMDHLIVGAHDTFSFAREGLPLGHPQGSDNV